jgi:twinkle protein
MRIKSLTSNSVYELEFNKSGENSSVCPECSEHRKNKKAKCFSFNVEKLAGYCSHCESRFVEYKPHGDKVYIRPVFDESFKSLKPEWVSNFLSKRGISESVLSKMKISEKRVWMPQSSKEEDVIAYPYFINGELINVKYRGANKSFKLESGAELCWYNYDSIIDAKELIIQEGEIDCLSFMEAGITNCVSVPNGASIGKMEYFDNSIHLLDKIERFYICVDNDEKGILLRDELIRRLGADKCYICDLRQYKDANEYLLAEGRESLAEVIKSAKNPKIDGVYELMDFNDELDILFEEGMKEGNRIGIPFLDDWITWELGRFAVWTAAPSAGKSEMVDFVNIKLNLLYGWKVAYFSPENFPMQNHGAKIVEKLIGARFSKNNMSKDAYLSAKYHIKDNFFWVNPDQNDIDTILSKFKFLIKIKGVKIVVLDPWNTIQFSGGYGDYGKILQKMVKFARDNSVLFHLVAHPRKLEKNKETGKFPMPTMYDIAGSSDFWNMSDYGLIIKRDQQDDLTFINEGQIQIAKVKFKHLGRQGIGYWKYNFKSGRYVGLLELEDTKSWLDVENEISEVKIINNIPLIPINNNEFFKSLDLDIPF